MGPIEALVLKIIDKDDMHKHTRALLGPHHGFEDLSLKDWVISAIGLDAQHLRAQNVSSSPSLEAEIYEVRKLLAVLRNGGRRAIDL